MENKRLQYRSNGGSHYRILGKNGRRTRELRYRIYLNGTQGGRNRENTWNIRGIKRTEKNGEPKEETDLGKQLYGTYPEKKTPD